MEVRGLPGRVQPPAPAAARPEARPELLEVQVAGVECAVCARRLTLHLRGRPGVESAIANPRTGVVRVFYRPAEISATNLFVEIRRAGFVPGGECLRMRLADMHCPSCARAIEGALLGHRGVERVRADHERGEVRVVFLPGKTDVAELAEEVTRLGYRLERTEGGPPGVG